MYWTRTTEKKAKLGSAFLNAFSSKKDVKEPAGDESKQPAEAVVEKPQIEMENLKGRSANHDCCETVYASRRATYHPLTSCVIRQLLPQTVRAAAGLVRAATVVTAHAPPPQQPLRRL